MRWLDDARCENFPECRRRAMLPCRFSYPSRPAVQVLKGFSLHIPRGSKVRSCDHTDVTKKAAH